MRGFRRLVLILFLLLVGATVLIFVLENQQLASLVFLGFSLPRFPLSVFVLIAFVVGLAVGPVLGFLSRLSASRRR